MKNIINKFKIPTILGLGIIVMGIIVGVYLTVREQVFISHASPNITPQNITLSNITDDSVTISWKTQSPVSSFISYGAENPAGSIALDDRDSNPPAPYSIHYATIKNLLPKTSYQFKIVSGKNSSEVSKFTTASPINQQVLFNPVIGSIIDADKPLNSGIVYLSIADATTLSSLVKDSGNFLIPLSQIRKKDLSESFPLTDETLIKLTIVSDKGQTNAIFKLKDSENTLPTIKLGTDLDLTANPSPNPTFFSTPAPSPAPVLNKFDLNGDGKVNAADNAIILQNIGKKGKNLPADLNGDGVVDQKDLGLMAKQINQ